MYSVSTASSASAIQMDYMKLLIAQLQNQNPLEPLDNNEMASQLAQFSQLQQIESMNSNFAKVLAAVEHTYANSLIGKNVSFGTENEAGETDIVTGTVEEVYNDVNCEIYLMVGQYILGLEDIISVKN